MPIPFWAPIAIDAAIQGGMHFFNKPKQRQADTSYFNRLINHYKGDVSGRKVRTGFVQAGMQPLSMANRRNQEAIMYNTEPGADRATATLANNQNYLQGATQVGLQAGLAESQSNAVAGDKIAELEARREQMIAQEKAKYQDELDAWKREGMGLIASTAGSMISGGLTAGMAKQNAYDQFLLAGGKGTAKEFMQQFQDSGFNDINNFVKGLPQQLKKQFIDKVKGSEKLSPELFQEGMERGFGQEDVEGLYDLFNPNRKEIEQQKKRDFLNSVIDGDISGDTVLQAESYGITPLDLGRLRKLGRDKSVPQEILNAFADGEITLNEIQGLSQYFNPNEIKTMMELIEGPKEPLVTLKYEDENGATVSGKYPPKQVEEIANRFGVKIPMGTTSYDLTPVSRQYRQKNEKLRKLEAELNTLANTASIYSNQFTKGNSEANDDGHEALNKLLRNPLQTSHADGQEAIMKFAEGLGMNVEAEGGGALNQIIIKYGGSGDEDFDAKEKLIKDMWKMWDNICLLRDSESGDFGLLNETEGLDLD